MEKLKKGLTVLNEYDKTTETVLNYDEKDNIILAKEEKIGNIIEKAMYYVLAISTIIVLARNLALWLM